MKPASVPDPFCSGSLLHKPYDSKWLIHLLLMTLLYIYDLFMAYLWHCCIFSFFSGWFRAILPKTALRVEEESWNAYPYTKTRYTCPFVEKFSIEIETKYFPDAGHQDNVFNLPSSEKKCREVGEYGRL